MPDEEEVRILTENSRRMVEKFKQAKALAETLAEGDAARGALLALIEAAAGVSGSYTLTEVGFTNYEHPFKEMEVTANA